MYCYVLTKHILFPSSLSYRETYFPTSLANKLWLYGEILPSGM